MPISIHTEADRLAHPEARLVPMKFIEMRPDRSLSELELRCIATPEAELETAWEECQASFPSALPEQAKINFLALVLWGHPELNVARIAALAVYGGFSLRQLVQVAAMTGRADLLERLIDQCGLEPVREAFFADGEGVNAVLLAIAFNNVGLLAYLRPEQIHQLITDEADHYFQLAAAQGHREVLAWLADKAPDQLSTMIQNFHFQAFREAAANGHLAVLQWLAEQAPGQFLAMIKVYNFRAFCEAATNAHLAVLQWLAEQAPDQLLAMIQANNFLAFCNVAQNGHLDILQWLAEQAPGQLFDMIRGYNFWAFCEAARNGHLAVLKWLAKQAPGQLLDMIQANDFGPFREAAENGHLVVLKWLAKRAPDQWLAMIQAKDFWAFCKAARKGHLAVLKWLAKRSPDQLLAMVKTNDFEPFRYAAANGHLGVLQWLAEQVPAQLLAMIKANYFGSFRYAAQNGHLDVLQRLAEQAPDQLLDMIQANNFLAFCNVAQNGHLDILQWLAEQAPDQLLAMIMSLNFKAFRGAAANGHLEVLKWLATRAPHQLLVMIKINNFEAFWAAAKNGHLEVLKWLADKASDRLLAMIKANNFETFREAATNGHLDVLQWLADKVPDRLIAMIKANNFETFSKAVANGHLEVLKWLADKAPDQLVAMREANYFVAFCDAAANGHLEVLEWLMKQLGAQGLAVMQTENFIAFRSAAASARLEVLKWLLGQVTPDQRADLLTADRLGIFATAVREGNVSLIQHLLNTPVLLGHAEAHACEYREFTQSFIAKRILDLRTRSQIFERANPAGVFDLSAEEGDWYFYAMRHLIRRNDPALLNDLRFLLSLPRLKNLAHQDTQQRAGGNELLRLAQSVGNSAAAQILLVIPAVRELAEANDYYRAERRGELDLAALANDRESSMRALTEGEQRRLATITHRYQVKLQAKRTDVLFEQLRNELRARYVAQPAKIKNKYKVDLVLPVEWMQFVALKLDKATYEAALKAYYQHPDHTALRYLSKPNRWMAPNASYVYVNETRTERWSTFEEYQDLIVLLWLAAQDVAATPMDNYTVETRVTHFIRELAYIGRAHNWDRTRVKYDATGRALLDAKGDPVKEEYDDEEGDKPSCYSGVKRRLFQALQGHPDMRFLSADGVNQELREYLRQHFKAKIECDANPHELYAAWEACILLEPEGASALERLNLSEAEQEAFTTYLTEKYGTDWLEDSQLKRLVDQAFKIEHPSDKVHAVKFAGLVNLESLLPVSTAETGVTESKECEDEDEAYSAASPRFGR